MNSFSPKSTSPVSNSSNEKSPEKSLEKSPSRREFEPQQKRGSPPNVFLPKKRYQNMDTFENFIKNLISSSRLDSTYTSLITDRHGLELFTKAFTHVSYNSEHNYEVFEQLGDITLNKFLVWYFHQRFPNFHSNFGVKIVARLRIKYGSKQVLSEIADRLNFWKWIRVSENISYGKKMSILEDVFEAFIGVTEYIIDSRIHPGLGYISCYYILKKLFDDIPIDISYEQLFDAKTRLKELFDINKDSLGSIQYDFEKDPKTGFSVVKVYRNYNFQKIFISSGMSDINKSIAEQTASENALTTLSQQGYTKTVPQDYKNLF